MPLRLKPVARSLSARAEFFGLELEDWGLVLAWAIMMRLIGDRVHRILFGLLPLSSLLAYGSSVVLVVVIRWAKLGKPRGFLISWVQHHFRPRAKLRAAVALHFMYYNFCRVHQTLRITPAMEAGLSDHIWTLEELTGLLDTNRAAAVA